MSPITTPLLRSVLLLTLTTTPLWAATYNPTNFADLKRGSCDAADCTLREAIIAANANPGTDTINLIEGTYTLTLDGNNEALAASGDLDITESVTLVGAGEATTLISGAAGGDQLDDRIFHIHPVNAADKTTISVTLQALTVEKGLVDAGNGGAILNESPGSLTLTDVTLRDNGTTNLGLITDQGLGGAIYNQGTLVISGGTIKNNSARVDQAGQRATYGGGALYNSSTATATISNAIFRGNSASNSYQPATPDPNFRNFSAGGAIVNLGTLLVKESVFGGTAETDGEGSVANISDAGGAIANVGGFLTVARTTFGYNKTTEAPANETFENAINGGGRAGGAIFSQNAAENRGSVVITGSTLTHNSSGTIGGGLFNSGAPITVTHSVINDNSSTFSGGGLVNVGSQPAEITNSTIAYNQAASSAGAGGGLWTTSRIKVSSVTIAGNSAATGAQIYLKDNSGTDRRSLPPEVALTATIIDHQLLTLDAAKNCGGDTVFIKSNSYNTDSGTSCRLGLSSIFSDRTDIDIKLDPNGLATNACSSCTQDPPTKTIALQSSSLAIDAINASACPSRDQRYYTRVSNCDTGAFEYNATEGSDKLADLKVTVTESADPGFVDNPLTYTMSVTNIGPDDADGVVLTITYPSSGISTYSSQIIDTGGACTTEGALSGTLRCNLSTVTAFQTKRVSLTVNPNVDGEIKTDAMVSSTGTATDYFEGNNSDDESTTIQATNNCTPGVAGCSGFPSSGGGGGGGTLHWLSLVGLLALWRWRHTR